MHTLAVHVPLERQLEPSLLWTTHGRLVTCIVCEASVNIHTFAGGPIPLPLSQNILQRSERTTLCIQNPNLGAQLLSTLNINGQPFEFPGVRDQETFDAPIDVLVEDELCIAPGESARFHARFQLLSDLKTRTDVFPSVPSEALDTLFEDTKPRWRLDNLVSTYVLRRNVEYILANCAIPVSNRSVAIVTDHVALPLGWNRDN